MVERKSVYGRVYYLVYRLLYISFHIIAFLLLARKREAASDSSEKKYILVCAIEAENGYSIRKLASFSSLCKKHFPNLELILLSRAKSLNKDEGEPVENYQTIAWHHQTRARISHPLGKLFFRRQVTNERYFVTIAKQAAFLVDLGQIQASSDVGTGWTANMLSNTVFAKAYQIPYYIFPQFFGPFSYPKPVGYLLLVMLKKVLPYSSAIAVQDQKSTACLESINIRDKVQPCLDLTLYTARQLTTIKTQNMDANLIFRLGTYNHQKQLDTLLAKLAGKTIHLTLLLDKNASLSASTLEQNYASFNPVIKQLKDYDLSQVDNNLYITNVHLTCLSLTHANRLALAVYPDRAVNSLFESLYLQDLICKDIEKFNTYWELAKSDSWKNHENKLGEKIEKLTSDKPLPLFTTDQ